MPKTSSPVAANNVAEGIINVTTSWVIVRISDNAAIAETFQAHVARAINKKKYRAVPIIEYLCSLNGGAA